jgi:ribosomal protein L40E
VVEDAPAAVATEAAAAFCSKCGAALEADSKFCKKCGASVS